MAVPKGKQSKQRTNTRFANFKATAPTLVECPHCHELKQPHKVCKKMRLLRRQRSCFRGREKVIDELVFVCGGSNRSAVYSMEE